MRPRYARSRLSALGSLVVVTLFTGVVVALATLPAVGGLGLGTKAAANAFESLPSELKTPPLPQRSTIYAADGRTIITSMYVENRIDTNLAQIPVTLQRAVVAIEDSRFYQHHGVDYRGILRALVANEQAGTVTQGASTLTQQYVKNVLVEQASATGNERAAEAATSRTPERKLREIRYALALERKLTKSQILERYLNIAYFGQGAYGVGIAALSYFGTPVYRLDLAQAAMLAGLVKNPTLYDPNRHPDQGLARRNLVLARMAEVGFISRAVAERAMAEKMTLRRVALPNGCVGAHVSPYFCDYLRVYLESDPAFAPTLAVRQARLRKGGLRIVTTIDPRLQLYAQRAVDANFSHRSKYASGLAAIQPGTGRVKALAVTRDFARDNNPYLTGSSDLHGYQSGSTFKYFTMLTALEKGLPLTTRIYAPYHYTSRILFNGRRTKPYSPTNDDTGMVGVFDMRQAFAASINTYYVQLEERVGVANAVKMAMRLGVYNPRFKQILAQPNGYGAFTLGVYDVTPLAMANAYATVAAKGIYCQPTPILSITDANGARLPIGKPQCHRAVAPGVANAAASAMTWVVNPQGAVPHGATGRAADIGRPVAGKTGTTQDEKNAWFVGTTPQLAAAVFLAEPGHPETLPSSKRNRAAAATFARFMRPAMSGLPIIGFPPPDPKYLVGQRVTVPDVAGQTVSQATTTLSRAGFGVQVSPQQVSAAPVPAGLVAYTSPAGGSSTSSGDLVTIYVSNGLAGSTGTSGAPPPRRSRPRPRPSKCPLPAPFCPPPVG